MAKKITKPDSAHRSRGSAFGPSESLVKAIEARLEQLTKVALKDELEQLARDRKDELAERLRPFETPVSEETMRRSLA